MATMTVARQTIARGDAGTAQTLYAMRQIVRDSLTHPLVRQTAVMIASREAPGELRAVVWALHDWAAGVFYFMRDPYQLEMLHRPEWQLVQWRERGRIYVDCDDAAMMLAALGEAVGVPARFVAVAFFDRRADFSHVWTELHDGTRWRIIDPTRGSQPLDMRLVTRIMVLDV